MSVKKTRIMYVENKSAGPVGPASIGRVGFSKSGCSLTYQGRTFQSLKGGGGLKANYFDVETGEEYWISGPKKDGSDRLSGDAPVTIDPEIAEEYWTTIRGA